MKGDIIKGNIIMNRHKVWRRHMTLQLNFTVLRNDNVIYPVWLLIVIKREQYPVWLLIVINAWYGF